MSAVQRGDKVRCLHGDIDRKSNADAIGVVTGFARFSSYHPREVSVSTEDGRWLGWFWESSVEVVAS